MASVDERSGKRQSILWRKFVWAGVALVVTLLGLCVEPEKWVISEVCPKCLQGTGTLKWTVFGLPIYRRTAVNQKISILRRSTRLGPETPKIDAGMYEEITGQKCTHDFVTQWFGRTSGFLFQIHADGGSTRWPMVQPWVAATEALYTTCAKTHDQEDTAALYGVIAESYEYIEHSDVTRRVTTQLAWAKDANDAETRAIIEPLEEYAPEAGVMAQKILKLRRLTGRLRGVETVEDLQAVRRDFVDESGDGNSRYGRHRPTE